MGDSGVREREGRMRPAGGPVSDLVMSKLRRPLVRQGTVRRSLLIERLARGDRRPIVSVVAPPGYGKTTVLAQWAERNGQAFAWVSVDERDNDPKVLLTYVAAALNAVEPIDERVFDALASPASSVPGSVVPRLGSAFSSMTSPVALVLDDVHMLRNRECQAALAVLADHVPGGSRLALAGRARPPLRVARLRAEGRILEIGPGDLSLDRGEASLLLSNADIAVGEDEMTDLHRRTEGWPAGLYLAALYLREGGPLAGAAVSFGGDDRLVSEYMESEFLARISRRRRAFLTRTAVLERMCGPLCDAVLEMSGSADALADLEQMRADAELAARTMAVDSFWRTAAILYLGTAHLMAGDPDQADAMFENAAAGGQAGGAAVGACVALAERSLLAIARGAWEAAERHLAEARSLARDANLGDYPPVAIVHAVAARIALHQADRPRAMAELTRAQHLRPGLTYAVPYLAVQARIELARCHLALSDVAAAQILLREVTEVLTRRPDLGVFVRQAQELQAELSRTRGSSALGASALTAAELRLLPMLPTHLSFPQIAGEMFLSPNTVKSEAMSIYRKLGASSRSQAVTRSRELGLLEG